MAVIGVLAGQIYRSDLANFKTYRLSPTVVRLSTRFLSPLIGTTRPIRRSNRALPDESRTDSSRTAEQSEISNDEVVTTARPSVHDSQAHTVDGGNEAGTGTSVMREWVDELTGRSERASAGIRAPAETEIATLTAMFPDVGRDVVVAALQRR